MVRSVVRYSTDSPVNLKSAMTELEFLQTIKNIYLNVFFERKMQRTLKVLDWV